MDSKTKFKALFLSFPTLLDAPGFDTDDFDAWAFAEWATGPAPSHGARCAAQFVLGVWNPGSYPDYGLPPFDIHEALGTWDDQHRQPFAGWCAAPFWP